MQTAFYTFLGAKSLTDQMITKICGRQRETERGESLRVKVNVSSRAINAYVLPNGKTFRPHFLPNTDEWQCSRIRALCCGFGLSRYRGFCKWPLRRCRRWCAFVFAYFISTFVCKCSSHFPDLLKAGRHFFSSLSRPFSVFLYLSLSLSPSHTHKNFVNWPLALVLSNAINEPVCVCVCLQFHGFTLNERKIAF